MKIVNKIVAVLLTVVTAAVAGPAAAAVMFHAYDSNGTDTGTCAERVSGGYALKTCNSSTAAQLFTFDVNGTGGPIAQSTECLVVLSGYTAGVQVGGRTCTDTTNFTSKMWRWTNGTQIVATESPSQGTCLSADGVTYSPPRLVLQACSATSLLTKWDVVQVP